MTDQLSVGEKPRLLWWRALLAVASVVAILIVSISLSILLIQLAVGLGLKFSRIDAGIFALALMQVLTLVFTLATARIHGPLTEVANLRAPDADGWRGFLTVFLVMAVVLGGYTIAVLAFAPDLIKRDLSIFLTMMGSPYWWVAVLAVAIGAPIAEELMFRGFLLNRLRRANVGFVAAALLSNVLWTSLHFQYSVVGQFEVFLAGLLLFWAIWKTKSLWVTIILHALYNLVALAVMWSLFL